jgi:hypothetical protein
MTLRLLLVGEGPTEMGTGLPENPPDPNEACGCVWLTRVVNFDAQKLGKRARKYEFVRCFRASRLVVAGKTTVRVAQGKLHLNRPAWLGKLVAATQLVKAYQLDGVVICQDREAKDNSNLHLYKLWEQVAESTVGIDGLLVIICNPCRSTETWLLADQRAVDKVLSANGESPFTGDPEDRPPPSVLKVWLEERASEVKLALEEAWIALAKTASPDQLARRCRTSYPPFREMAQQLLE